MATAAEEDSTWCESFLRGYGYGLRTKRVCCFHLDEGGRCNKYFAFILVCLIAFLLLVLVAFIVAYGWSTWPFPCARSRSVIIVLLYYTCLFIITPPLLRKFRKDDGWQEISYRAFRSTHGVFGYLHFMDGRMFTFWTDFLIIGVLSFSGKMDTEDRDDAVGFLFFLSLYVLWGSKMSDFFNLGTLTTAMSNDVYPSKLLEGVPRKSKCCSCMFGRCYPTLCLWSCSSLCKCSKCCTNDNDGKDDGKTDNPDSNEKLPDEFNPEFDEKHHRAALMCFMFNAFLADVIAHNIPFFVLHLLVQHWNVPLLKPQFQYASVLMFFYLFMMPLTDIYGKFVPHKERSLSYVMLAVVLCLPGPLAVYASIDPSTRRIDSPQSNGNTACWIVSGLTLAVSVFSVTRVLLMIKNDKNFGVQKDGEETTMKTIRVDEDTTLQPIVFDEESDEESDKKSNSKNVSTVRGGENGASSSNTGGGEATRLLAAPSRMSLTI